MFIRVVRTQQVLTQRRDPMRIKVMDSDDVIKDNSAF